MADCGDEHARQLLSQLLNSCMSCGTRSVTAAAIWHVLAICHACYTPNALVIKHKTPRCYDVPQR